MNNGRRVELDVTYNNAPFAGQVGAEIESLTYVDNAADDSDSIDITLDAQDSKWLHGWLPEEGATLRPRIIAREYGRRRTSLVRRRCSLPRRADHFTGGRREQAERHRF